VPERINKNHEISMKLYAVAYHQWGSMRWFFILLIAPSVARPQTAPPIAPAFEAASIKPSGPKSVRGSDGGPGSTDPSLYRFGRATLLDLIWQAYDAPDYRISSKFPLEDREFDFAARVPEGSTKAQFRTMLQSFLAERFHLKVHMESRELPAFALVIAKTGLKLKQGVKAPPTSPDDGWPVLAPNQPGMWEKLDLEGGVEVARLKVQQEPLSVVIGMLRNPGDLPFIDETGLTGKYDFNLEFTRELPSVAAEGPTAARRLFQALEKQLGLQLIRKKLPFDVVIVDSVDQVPMDN
jgi:uncharacterized protein (TIGR03435 family)